MKRRVVVTGLGAVTPIGNTVEEFWSGIKEGKVGIGEITKFDTTEYKVKIAAEVKDFKAARRMEPFSQYAVAAAKEAFEDAGLDMSKEDPFRVGVIVGSGIGSLQAVEKEYEKIRTKGPGRVNPLLVPMMISNMAAGNISIQLGLKGKCTNVVTACASGTNCIGDAFRAIQYGDAEVMLAGGAEGCICETGVAGFTSLTALSTSTDPMKASRPFDKDRDGFVLGEGAGVVVLEELEHAKKRNANNNVVQSSMLNLSDTVLREMHITLLLRQKTEAVQPKQWNLRWKKAESNLPRWITSTHTEPVHITMTCSRHVRSNWLSAMRQKML